MTRYRRRLEAGPLATDYELGSGLLGELALPGRFVVITDENVSRLYPDLLGTESIVLPAGEESKRLEQVRAVYDRLADLAVDRDTALVAFGGGVVGDLAGFVAATYLRGLPFYQVPTTLLAMVDSSLGGKVGVDLPQGKNLVGAFYPPVRILADTDLLRTLPPSEWASGMAEVIKHAVLDSEEHLASLEALPDRPTPEVVYRSACVKMNIVEDDPFERGRRAHLNLGHTLGHALEAACDYRGLSHGQAVALGMLAACRLSAARGLLEDAGLENRLADLFSRHGLPVRLEPELAWNRVLEALRRDKKNREGALTFVLPRRAGSVETVAGVDPDLVRQVFSSLT